MNRWMAEKLKTARSEKGMSIVELVVGIVILLILLAGVLFFFDFGITNFKLAQARAVLGQKADNVMEKMVRQVRVASSFLLAVGSGPLGASIYFTGDVLGDGTTCRVNFYHSSDKKLMRICSSSLGSSTVVIANGVTALEFRYYGKDGQPLVPPDKITYGTHGNKTLVKTVQIRLVMERPVPGRSPISSERIGTVVIRGQLI